MPEAFKYASGVVGEFSHSRLRPLRETIHRAPLVGGLRKGKCREGSHISVSVFGRYPPTDDVMLFVRFSNRPGKASLYMAS